MRLYGYVQYYNFDYMGNCIYLQLLLGLHTFTQGTYVEFIKFVIFRLHFLQ